MRSRSISYIEKIIRPNETILARGKLHWIIFWPAISWFIAAVLALLIFGTVEPGTGWTAFAIIMLVAIVLWAKALLQREITEIVITDRRVIYKTGLVERHTAEMNTDKVESVEVDQSITGRLLDYGSIHVRGTGVGLEHLHYVASPLSLRNAITVN